MKLRPAVIAAYAASATLFALVCFTAVHAQEADDSGIDDAKTPPAITQVAGTWTGTDTGSFEVGGGQQPASGPMTLDLSQNKKTVDGTFTLTTTDETPGGSAAGKITNDTLMLRIHATMGTTHDCTAAVVATVDGDTMSGTFLVQGPQKYCKAKGTFDLERQ
ncbi:MAG: hypothetical protein ACLQAT_18060 [Candidatus Binataceae bacterium]